MRAPIYLDYMSTTPTDERVLAAMQPYFTMDGCFGNPNSNHYYGLCAKDAVATARMQVAQLINANPNDIIFSAGATESNNIAIMGACLGYRNQGNHIITSKIEHKSVLACFEYLAKNGFEVTYLGVDQQGFIDLQQLKKAIKPQTIFISIMQANNEIGSIQDIAAVSQIAKQHGALLHVDAAQSIGKIAIDLQQLPIDLLSLSAHKIYGPKGIGALYMRSQPKINLQTIIHGAGHELGIRSGTQAVPLIVGLGKACEIEQQEMTQEVTKLTALRDRLWQGIKNIPHLFLNGPQQQRLCNNLNIGVSNVHGEALFVALQAIAVSSGSACTSESITSSHVLKAIGLSDALAQSSMRISLGRYTNEADIEQVIALLQREIPRLQTISAC